MALRTSDPLQIYREDFTNIKKGKVTQRDTHCQ